MPQAGFIGVLLFLIPVIAGLWQVRRLRHSALPWIDGQALVEALAPSLGVHRSIDALVHEAVTGPVTCGVLKPAIILPASAQQWDETALRCAAQARTRTRGTLGLFDAVLVEDGLRCGTGSIRWSGPRGDDCDWKQSGPVTTLYCARTMQPIMPPCSFPSRGKNRVVRGSLFSQWRVAAISLRVWRQC